MIVAGLDPGQTGAVALYDGTSLKQIIDMTVVDKHVDPHPLYLALKPWAVSIKHAYVENVHSMPKQGVSSSFKFGRSFGMLLGLLTALEVPYTLVDPQRWKREMGIAAGSDKKVSRRRAMELLPSSTGSFIRVKDDGRAEAALIALWGWKQENRK